MATYNWKSTGYQFISNAPISPTAIFSLHIAWTVADAAAARGYVQLINDGSGSNPPKPEEILDFSMTATALDPHDSMHWSKPDLPIKFSGASEPYSSNLQLAGGKVFLGDSALSKNGYVFSQADATHFEVRLPDGTVYLIAGDWKKS